MNLGKKRDTHNSLISVESLHHTHGYCSGTKEIGWSENHDACSLCPPARLGLGRDHRTYNLNYPTKNGEECTITQKRLGCCCPVNGKRKGGV
uniref:Uncharacterized protein n=1 Tax=Romanomermis culicivorax TaxID=13658 RepID=A0A915IT72_ROMCU